MERMIIKHLSGSKANQVEEYPLHHYSELLLGRDSSATVQYDADRDDLVGRLHAKISRDPNDENAFLIEDLNSRNGTFLNKKRLTGAQKLHPGDSVQLGPGGPEFTFDVEPRPKNATKPTRVVESVAVAAGGIGSKITPQTRVADSAAGEASGLSQSISTAPAMKNHVGKATVERMISHSVNETKQAEGKKFAKIGGAAAIAVLILFGVVIGGGYWYSVKQKAATQAELERQKAEADQKAKELESQSNALKDQLAQDKANAPLAAAEISDKYGKSVVFIQGSWELINKESKSQIYHQFIPNSREVLTKIFKDQDYGKGPIIPDGPKSLPVYVQTQDSYEPYLTDQKSDLSFPIGGAGYSCSGFIVTADGFILTNRHCTSPWKAQYGFPDGYPPGILIGQDGKIAGAGVKPPTDWIPDNTKSGPRQYKGNYDAIQKLTVMLPGTDNPIEAQKVQDSPVHDVGMLKISVPGNLPKVVLFDSYDTIKKGEGLVIMGYPGSAPEVYAPLRSQNPLNQEQKFTVIPDPTVTVTSVGNIVRNSNPNDLANQRVSIEGDTIRYAGGLTWSGNSGGPVFDMNGRVVGLHFAGEGVGRGNISGMAVPIRYGMKLFPGGSGGN